MKIFLSVSLDTNLVPPDPNIGGHRIESHERGWLWEGSRLKAYLHYLREGLGVFRAARSSDVLLLCTVNVQLYPIVLLRWLTRSKLKIVVADFLRPSSARSNLIAFLLRKVDAFICIRQGDIANLHQDFGVDTQRCFFAHFPYKTHNDDDATPLDDHGYIYAAGRAHRDWPTLLQALAQRPYPAKLAADHHLDMPPNAPHLQNIGLLKPHEGRAIAAHSKIIIMPMHDTHLPSGPLVLLDAMALGKPIIATNVNGTRDYLQHNITGLLVPPNDPIAMGHAIDQLIQDPELRQRLAHNAQKQVETYSTANFFEKCVEVCEGVKKQQ